MNFEYWYMLPIATLISTIAMASGVEGGTFFAPIFMLALGLPPEVAKLCKQKLRMSKNL